MLKKFEADDNITSDSFLWANLSDFTVGDTSGYWNDLCNGTNLSEANKLPGDTANFEMARQEPNVSVMTANWKFDANSTCTEFLGDEPKVPLEAYKECAEQNTECGGLLDVGCSGQKMLICKAGSTVWAAGNNFSGSCVMSKPLGWSPEGEPRPPLELAFWTDYCKYREKGRKLRIMFEGKNCAESAVKVLADAANPVECAEQAAKDEVCTAVFDFRFGPPPVCRCLKVDSGCQPANATGGHVYAPSLQ